MKTLNQKRASFVLRKVEKMKGNKDYSTTAKKFPALVMTNGLLPALAFVKKKQKEFYDHMSEWFKEIGLLKDKEENESKKEKTDLLEFLSNTDSTTLRIFTMEALEIADWFKRIAEVELE